MAPKERLAPRRSILALEKECLWCGGHEQDGGPEAASQGWEWNPVFMLSWGGRWSRKSLCPRASPELDHVPALQRSPEVPRCQHRRWGPWALWQTPSRWQGDLCSR